MPHEVSSFGRPAEPTTELQPDQHPVRPQMAVTVIPILDEGVLEEISEQVFETVRAATVRGLQVGLAEAAG